MHTTCSDGTDSLKELLRKADKMYLEVISITDHDSCDSYLNFKKFNRKKYFKK